MPSKSNPTPHPIFDVISRLRALIPRAEALSGDVGKAALGRLVLLADAFDALRQRPEPALLPSARLNAALPYCDLICDSLEVYNARGMTEEAFGAKVASLGDLVIGLLDWLAMASAETGSGWRSDAAMDRMARSYGEEAKAARRAISLFRIAGMAVVLVGAGAAVVVGFAWHKSWPSASHIVAPVFLGLVVFGGLLLFLGERERREELEARRLAIQSQAFSAYIGPLPLDLQHVVRTMMVQRLFPRVLQDTDPLREPQWPPVASLLDAVIKSGPDDGPEPAQAPEETGSSNRKRNWVQLCWGGIRLGFRKRR